MMGPFPFLAPMNPTSIPLVDELVSALAAAREEICRIQNQGNEGTPDPSVLDMTQAAIDRFELERDRTDLNAATLPARIVITLQDGALTACITDSTHPIEVAVVCYDVPSDWDGENMVMVPQHGAEPVAAQGFLLEPGHMPERTRELHRAVYRAGCHAHNTTEH